MAEILTQDSISLTERLDGVCFCYLEISSRKAGRIGHKHGRDTNKGAKSYCSVSAELRGNRHQRRCSSHRWSKEKEGMVKFSVRSLSLDTFHVSEEGKWCQMLSLVRRYIVNCRKCLHQQMIKQARKGVVVYYNTLATTVYSRSRADLHAPVVPIRLLNKGSNCLHLFFHDLVCVSESRTLKSSPVNPAGARRSAENVRKSKSTKIY